MLAAPPGSEPCSKAMARAPASRASIPAATPAPPAPTMAMSVSYCLPPAIEERSLFAEHAHRDARRFRDGSKGEKPRREPANPLNAASQGVFDDVLVLHNEQRMSTVPGEA